MMVSGPLLVLLRSTLHNYTTSSVIATARKRTYQADSIHAQQLLEEQLAKRARVVSSAKRRRRLT